MLIIAPAKNTKLNPDNTKNNPISNGPNACPTCEIILLKDINPARLLSLVHSVKSVREAGRKNPCAIP